MYCMCVCIYDHPCSGMALKKRYNTHTRIQNVNKYKIVHLFMCAAGETVAHNNLVCSEFYIHIYWAEREHHQPLSGARAHQLTCIVRIEFNYILRNFFRFWLLSKICEYSKRKKNIKFISMLHVWCVCVIGTFELLPNVHRRIERSNYLHELFLKRFATQQKKNIELRWIFFWYTCRICPHIYIDTIGICTIYKKLTLVFFFSILYNQ